jgi:glycosyltransferase involved in cell wall biosynthesis
MNKKKVCFILSTLNPGGVENYLLRFLSYVNGRYDVTVLCAYEGQIDLLDEYVALGVAVVFRKTGYYNPLNWVGLYQYFMEKDFDVVCNFAGNFAGFSILIAKLSGIKKRITAYRRSSHGFKTTNIKLLYDYIVKQLVFMYSTNIISNSEYALKVFYLDKYKTDSRFRVIRNGIDSKKLICTDDKATIKAKYGIPVNSYVIGHVARYDPSKNHKTIFKVALEIFNKCDDAIFIFCGKETDCSEMRKMAAETDVKRVYLLGTQPDVSSIYKMMDLFYFPSVTEGQPNALIEAMLCGLPVVTSSIEPIKEVIPEVDHHRLIDALDVKTAVETLISIKNEPDTRAKYMFKEWAQKMFDPANNFKEFCKVIDEI